MVVPDVNRDKAVVVIAVPLDGEDDAGCSVNPCSGDDFRGACSLDYIYSFSVPGRETDSTTTWLRVTARIGRRGVIIRRDDCHRPSLSSWQRPGRMLQRVLGIVVVVFGRRR